jgi:hypothetical protein
MQLVVAADVPEGQKAPQSDLDKIFEQVEVVDPHGLALKMYKSFKSTSGKSLKSVLSSTATRLTVFNYAQIERLTCADTISLKTIGDEKCALFIITPPTDNGFNFLVAMMYSQLFSKLYYHYQFECRYLLTDNDYIVNVIREFEAAYEIEIENESRVIVDVAGHDVSFGEDITNNGYLKITNSSDTNSKIKVSESIINDGDFNLDNLSLLATKDTDVVKNDGNLVLTNSNIQSKNG